MSKLNIINEDTWQFATDNDFVWKEDTCFNEENNKKITEREMVPFLRQIMNIIDDTVGKQKTINYGREKVITFVLDSIFAKVIPEDIPSEVLCLIDMGLEPNIVHTVYQSIKNKQDSKKNGKLNIIDETTWEFASDDEFIWKDKIINGSLIDKSITTCTEKVVVKLFKQALNFKNDFIQTIGKDKIIIFILDRLSNGESIEKITPAVVEYINNYKLPNESSSSIPSKTQDGTKPNITYTPVIDDSKPGVFMTLGIVSMIVTAILFFTNINSIFNSVSLETGNIATTLITVFLPLIFGIIFLSKYSKERNKKNYYEICKSMEYWLGRKHDELIVSWGTPSKTSKLPNDKAIIVLEYKNSTTNYSGYSMRSRQSGGMSFGYHAGQANKTLYVKTFYVKDGWIFDYKYAIN